MVGHKLHDLQSALLAVDIWVLAAAKMMPEAAVVVAPGWRVSAEMFS